MVILGAGITDIQGKIAGNAFTRDKSCLHINANARYIQRSSTSIIKRRKAYRTCVNYWNSETTETTRQQWQNYAKNHPGQNKIGEQITWTAYNAFMWLNIYRIFNDLEISPKPPET